MDDGKSPKDVSGSPTGENEDGFNSNVDFKKKYPTKSKVNNLFRRASTASTGIKGKHMNGHLPQELKNRDADEMNIKKNRVHRRYSERITLDHNYIEEEEEEEEEEGGELANKEKKKGKVKVKFVPQRGFAITTEKAEDEPKGAHGYTPRKGSKEKSLEDLGAHGFTPRDKTKYLNEDEMEYINVELASKEAFMDLMEDDVQKPHSYSPGLNGNTDGTLKKKHKNAKIKLPSAGHRSSKENVPEDGSVQKKKGSVSAEELDDDDFYGTEDCKPKHSKHKISAPVPRKSRTSNKLKEGGSAEDMSGMKGPDEAYDEEQDEPDFYKPKKQFKLKVPKKFKHKVSLDNFILILVL
ncbi:ABC transporter F family member 4 [Nematolebias whitei]|uniref:ABC transporter F family member 4 n=1 Tax=Nematolebias whitei TaxID=451745 RepID=UPI00189701A8|nr:ABC transporter F family member 4 [Nematolebias whitei]